MSNEGGDGEELAGEGSREGGSWMEGVRGRDMLFSIEGEGERLGLEVGDWFVVSMREQDNQDTKRKRAEEIEHGRRSSESSVT